MARATFTNALQFTLKALARYPTGGLPPYTPNVDELLAALSSEPLDSETADLVREYAAQKNAQEQRWAGPRG
jgi:HEPN domain-containing protein